MISELNHGLFCRLSQYLLIEFQAVFGACKCESAVWSASYHTSTATAMIPFGANWREQETLRVFKFSFSAPAPCLLPAPSTFHRRPRTEEVSTMTDTNNLKQRRGKKSSTSAATPPGVEVSQPPSTSPLEQLRSAQERLIISRDRTADLHAAWRGQLFRLSLIVVFVAIYQLQTSISACIREVKDYDAKKATTISGARAMQLIFGDSFSELIGVIISSLLAYFLAISSTDVSYADMNAWPYMLSSALTPICLGFFFNSKSAGCLVEEDEALNNIDSVDDKRHQFPAVVIYHTIVTIAFWFMKTGLQQCEDNVKLCTQSIKDFERMNKTTRPKLGAEKTRNK